MQAPADSLSSDYTLQAFQLEQRLQNKTPTYGFPPPVCLEDVAPRGPFRACLGHREPVGRVGADQACHGWNILPSLQIWIPTLASLHCYVSEVSQSEHTIKYFAVSICHFLSPWYLTYTDWISCGLGFIIHLFFSPWIFNHSHKEEELKEKKA